MLARQDVLDVPTPCSAWSSFARPRRKLIVNVQSSWAPVGLLIEIGGHNATSTDSLKSSMFNPVFQTWPQVPCNNSTVNGKNIINSIDTYYKLKVVTMMS